MATEIFNIRPEDGWVEVTSAGTDFVKIRSTTKRHAFFVTSGSLLPAATDPGFKVDCHDFCVNVANPDNYYVRTANEQPGYSVISVFSIPSA